MGDGIIMDTIPKRKIINLRSQSKVGEATLYGLNLEFAICNLKSDGSELIAMLVTTVKTSKS